MLGIFVETLVPVFLVLAAGFVLRVVGGAVAIHVPVSRWLLLCAYLLALYLASKRSTSMPLAPELKAILPSDEEALTLQERVLDSYNEENGLPAGWNQRLREFACP